MGYRFSSLVENLVCEKGRDRWTETKYLESHYGFQVLDSDVLFHGLLAIF